MEGGVCLEGEEGASKEGGLSGTGEGPDSEASDGEDGLRGGLCDVGEVRADAKATAAALRGAESSKRTDTGLVRVVGVGLPGAKAEAEPWTGLEVEAEAERLTLGVLVFLRATLPPRVRWVCS